jgi:high-affinity nickel permease
MDVGLCRFSGRKLMQTAAAVSRFLRLLGHSTVVVLETAAIALSATTLRNQFDAIKDFGGFIRTTVSALTC